jgi:hypothetical protein
MGTTAILSPLCADPAERNSQLKPHWQAAWQAVLQCTDLARLAGVHAAEAQVGQLVQRALHLLAARRPRLGGGCPLIARPRPPPSPPAPANPLCCCCCCRRRRPRRVLPAGSSTRRRCAAAPSTRPWPSAWAAMASGRQVRWLKAGRGSRRCLGHRRGGSRVPRGAHWQREQRGEASIWSALDGTGAVADSVWQLALTEQHSSRRCASLALRI